MITSISKLILTMFISASFRSANIQPNPNDFEYRGGIETISGSRIAGFIERENGIRYKGFKLLRESKYTLLDIYYKEAQSIDRQSFGMKYPIENFSIGITLNSIRWRDMQVLQLLRYKNEILTMSYEIGENRQYLSSRLSKKIMMVDAIEKLKKLKAKGGHHNLMNVYVEPMMTYYKQFIDGNTTDFWSMKFVIGYKFL